MQKSLSPELARLLDSVSLTFTCEQFLTNDTPSVQNWHVTATAHHWGESNSADETEVVAHMRLVKGSLIYESLWDDLDTIAADLSTVASAVLDLENGDLREDVIDRVEGNGSS